MTGRGRQRDARCVIAIVGAECARYRVCGDERPAGGLDAVDERQAVDQRAPEAVEHRHHQPLRDSGLDAPDRLLQQRSIHSRAGRVELLEDLEHVRAAGSGPRADLFALECGRDDRGPARLPTLETRM